MEQLTHRELEASGLYYLGQNNSPQALLYFKQIASHALRQSKLLRTLEGCTPS
jgi:hypothetical protein